MKRILIFLLLSALFSLGSSAQKMIGFGGELSVLSFKPNLRMWFSKTTGFEIFGGIASELDDIDPNDVEAGFKFLHAIQYNRTDRTYIGLIGKWKWVNVYDSDKTSNLPVPGVIIGKEWYSKRINRKGFAIELGYQFDTKEYDVFDPNHIKTGKERFEEFPLILNFRYSFYSKK
ncbi:MAG: hypothetical protein Q8S54_15390 [Bacteroidota bacterium]|nr:hypothetical protein [Bacteroidota bacterium]